MNQNTGINEELEYDNIITTELPELTVNDFTAQKHHQNFNFSSIQDYLKAFKQKKTSNSAPSILISPQTSCSDLKPEFH